MSQKQPAKTKPLPLEAFPTVPALPRVLHNRIDAIERSTPHFEDSLYGPVNAMLNYYFNLRSSWMVKPGLIQPHLALPKPSSTRAYNRWDVKISKFCRPEFVVTTFSESLGSDIARLVVEVKPSSAKWSDSEEQLGQHMKTLSQGQREGHGGLTMIGLLIVGCKVRCFEVTPENQRPLRAPRVTSGRSLEVRRSTSMRGDYKLTAEALGKYLFSLAGGTWVADK